jgi:hypothetical protein
VHSPIEIYEETLNRRRLTRGTLYGWIDLFLRDWQTRFHLALLAATTFLACLFAPLMRVVKILNNYADELPMHFYLGRREFFPICVFSSQGILNSIARLL